jgi:hypothetical protein
MKDTWTDGNREMKRQRWKTERCSKEERDRGGKEYRETNREREVERQNVGETE